MREHVWAGATDAPAWMTGGTYMVTRRIRMRLEHWDRSALSDQEATIGRSKLTGAPLGRLNEHDPPELAATDAKGKLVIPADAHIRLAAPAENGDARILRRGYSFSDGIDPVTGELDAGLFFVAFQRDPRRQFIPLQQRLAENDALNDYIEHDGSAAFAVLPGVTTDAYLGHPLHLTSHHPTVGSKTGPTTHFPCQLLVVKAGRGTGFHANWAGFGSSRFGSSRFGSTSRGSRGSSSSAARAAGAATRGMRNDSSAPISTTTAANRSATRVPPATLVRSACCRIVVSCALVDAGGS